MITHEDLLDAGWPQSPLFGDLIEEARRYEEKGIEDASYILKLLARDFPKPDPKIRRREESAEWGEAIEATCEEDENNISAVRRCMGQLLRTPVIERGAVMPDACPAGPGEAVIPVGGAIAVKNAILPAAHSADVCCSMYASFFQCEDRSTTSLLDSLMESTRFGPGGRSKENRVHHPVIDEPVWDNHFLTGLQHYAAIHIADQGDGNHFAYLGKLRVTAKLTQALSEAGYGEIGSSLEKVRKESPDGDATEVFTLVTHHGSRGLGAQVYKRGHKAAIRETERIADGIPKAAAWLDTETDLGKEYWEALQYVGRWTLANHQSIHQQFLEKSASSLVTEFGNEHNFVWKKGEIFLHGKGATPAWKDEEGRPLLGLIPLNMSEPILMTLGKDNSDYLGFAPHGAGRNRSRTATLREFKDAKGQLDEKRVAKQIAETTEGLDIRWWHGKADLTESPIGYKNAAQVREQIEEFSLAEIVAEITPLGCIMAGDGGPQPWMRRKEQLSPKQVRQIGHRAERRKERQKYSNADLETGNTEFE